MREKNKKSWGVTERRKFEGSWNGGNNVERSSFI